MSEHNRSENLVGLYLGREDTSLTIRPPDVVDLDTNYIRLPLEIRSAGLAAEGSLDLAGWGGWVVGFIAYLDDLAANWRGWTGAKVWSDDSSAVAMSATHNGMSEIHLAVKLRPFYGSHDRGTWELEVVVPIEAGRMPDIASAAGAMLARAGVPLQWLAFGPCDIPAR
jgi:hypothetical protein